jgi:hypothetical protein
MHDVENVETSAPSAAVRSVRAEFSTTSVVMPLIIWRRGNPLNHPALCTWIVRTQAAAADSRGLQR